MTMIKIFWRDRRGSLMEKAAVGALIATLGAYFVGHSVERYAVDGELPSLAFLEPGLSAPAKSKSPRFNSIDLSTTGSIKGQVIVLDPCTGQEKN
jgi:hypothetical protein